MKDFKTLDDIESQKRNEETTKLSIITPIITEKWGGTDNIVMEYYFTKGKINVGEDNEVTRGERKKIDYLLLFKSNILLALVEAKGQDHSADEGYQQAKDYAMLLDVPFAYATNGKILIEADMLTGRNREMSITEFPGPDELWERYKAHKKLTSKEELIIDKPFYYSSDGKKPRYYQRIAINRTIEAITKGQDRVLLVMATGTGKTYVAFQIIYRFWKSREKKKILFLADRNILIDQTMRNDFKPFSGVMTKIRGRDIPTEYEVYLSLYHQLKSPEKNYYEKLPRDFFDLIVIDECHRGSADEASEWHEILQYFNRATQIGLTATPKETEDVSNISYFGEPVYTYSLKQGIEDGFLAPYKVISVNLDIDINGYRPKPGMLDVDGEPVEDRLYEQKDFDRKIIVDERREIVAKRISDFLKESGNRYAKTIVFCEDIPHAEEMTRLLENENSDLVAEDARYVTKITGDDDVGKAQLDNFIDPSSKYPVIAVTSRLMSTGIDAQTCEVIVLDKTIGSMTEFKQIIGRGTRIKENYKIGNEFHSKQYFTILDFRKNYLKFKDPEFDGEPVVIYDVSETGEFPKTGVSNTNTGTGTSEPNKKVRVRGVDVEIVGENVIYITEDGTEVKENIVSCIKNNIKEQFKTLEDFKLAWNESDNKVSLADDLLLESKIGKKFLDKYGFVPDDYDIIQYLGYGIPPLPKEGRIEKLKASGVLDNYNDKQKEIIYLLLEVYKDNKFDFLRNLKVFNLPIFGESGWSTKTAVKSFGNKKGYLKMLDEIESKLY